MADIQKRSGELASLLESLRPAIEQALPKHISPDRIARIALTALRTTKGLADCTPHSFLASIMQASQLGLEVNSPLGQAYLIPFRDNRSNTTICTLIIGYQGYMDLARRSGLVSAIYAYPVFDGDVFAFEYGLNPKLEHKPTRKTQKLTDVYAVARLKDGEPIFTVLGLDDVEYYRRRSKAANSGPWVTDYNAMALKTAIRRLYTWLPKSAEQARAQVLDEAAERDERPQLNAFAPEIAGMFQAEGDDEEEAQQRPPEPSKLDKVVRAKQAEKAATQARTRKPKEPEPEPTSPEVISRPAVKSELSAAHLHAVMALRDVAWKPEENRALFESWTAEQRNEAYVWAVGDPKAAPPPHVEEGPVLFERDPEPGSAG